MRYTLSVMLRMRGCILIDAHSPAAEAQKRKQDGGGAAALVMSQLTEREVLKRSRATSLATVRNLNCWGCGFSDVSVLAGAEALEVVNLRYPGSCYIELLTIIILSPSILQL